VVRFAVLAAMLCGCAQIFGIDETTGGAPAASLEVQRVSIGAKLVYAPQDLAASMASFLVADEADPTGLTRVPAEQTEPGIWTAPLRDPTPLLFDLPDFPTPIPRLFDFPVPQVKTLFGVLEHPNPQPAPPGATLTVNATLETAHAATDTYQLFTLGSWNQVALPAPAVGATTLAPPAVAVTAMTSITGRPHEAITADDAVVVLRYTGNQLRGALRAPPFEQTGADTITGTVANAALEAFTVKIDQAAAAARFTAVRPVVGTPTAAWTLRAAPGGILNNDQGPLLNSGGPTDPMTISFMAANPFADLMWTSTMLWQMQATRAYTPPSAGLPVTLVANAAERAGLAAGLEMRLPAGLPTRISLNGTLLVNDGVSIAKPARGVEVAFETDVAANTMYQLQLFKLVPNEAMPPTALVRQQKLGASGAAPRFTLPPELFEAGGLYTLRAVAVQGGFPGAADGDFTQRELPIGVSFVDSGVFEVMQ
jgi:hypothetical protein